MKKTKTLLLLSLLSIALLFTACNKKNKNNDTGNDKTNTNNESNISINENMNNENDVSTNNNQSDENADSTDTPKKEANILYTIKTITSYSGDIQHLSVIHFDEHNRVVKNYTYRAGNNDVIYLLSEYKYSEHNVELTETRYNDDGSISTTDVQNLERTNYDNGYYKVNNILYDSKNQIVADASVAGNLHTYEYNEKGDLIKDCDYEINHLSDGAINSDFLLSELVKKDISQLQDDSILLNPFRTFEYELDDNGLAKSYTLTMVMDNETRTMPFQYKHTLDDYGNPIKTEISFNNILSQTITYEYTYAE